MTPRPSSDLVVASLLIIGVALYLVLHFLEPDLSITWSHAHLSRRPFLPWLAGLLVVALPLLMAVLWRRPFLHRPLTNASKGSVLAFFFATFLVLLGVSLWYPQIPHAVDSAEFIIGATEPGFRFNPRWYLSIRIYRVFSALLAPLLTPEQFARSANVLVGAVALTALAGCARNFAATRGEALAMTLLLWSSMGVLQMSVGYLDIYPVPMAATAIYLWLAFRVLAGQARLLGPLLIAGVGPFFYIGLTLLAPSTILLILYVARQQGPRTIVAPILITLGAAILATVPGHSTPLAWGAWYEEAAQAASCAWGFTSESCLLPLGYMLSVAHFNEMLHLLLLVDGIGLLLMLVCSSSEFVRDPRKLDLRIAILAIIAAGHFAYLLALDPLFGQYSDWDAYTYPAVSVTLLGGYGFVLWGRRQPALFGALLGIALAAGSVHLLARLNAMHIDYHRHLWESPCHVNCGPAGPYYESCRNCAWDGRLLLCECPTANGDWRPTGAMQSCPSGYRNDDGILRCD